MRAAVVFLCLLVLGTSWTASAQPFLVEPKEFEPDLTEPMQRLENNYTGFVYDFNTGKVNF